MSPPAAPISVLFCCLGNICRSPMAEAVFADCVREKGLEAHFETIDSCGTGAYHEGQEADDRTLAVLSRHNVPSTCRARKVVASDFKEFDWIFGMDNSNVRNLQAQAPKSSKARVELFSAFDDGKEIKDPYYGGSNGFDRCYEQCRRYSFAFLKELGLSSDAQL